MYSHFYYLLFFLGDVPLIPKISAKGDGLFWHNFIIFILTNFYKTIPKELEDAARIDGCTHFGIYWRIVLPLSKASMSSVAIISFITSWNSFLWPMLSLRTDKWKPLSVGVGTYVGSFLNSNGFQYGPSLAAACMAIVPTVLVYLLLQKNFIQGISNTGLKG